MYQIYGTIVAPPAGLEPATSWLTVMRSTNNELRRNIMEQSTNIKYAYFPKHSQNKRLDTLSFISPCLGYLLSQNDIQSFYSVVYQLS